MERGMNIGQAVEVLKQGKRLSREGWADCTEVFIFMQVPATINKQVVPGMQSLPQLVKDHFKWTFGREEDQINAIYYTDQVAIVSASNLIRGWSPQVADLFANDWYIID